ncbi:hypothetical protein [Paracoccus sp. ME4]|uniref:hypothetical protein n=1 Tax=Paracoccus sp. ME4 TaxID=3138066 RepID=UPI00398B3C52
MDAHIFRGIRSAASRFQEAIGAMTRPAPRLITCLSGCISSVTTLLSGNGRAADLNPRLTLVVFDCPNIME